MQLLHLTLVALLAHLTPTQAYEYSTARLCTTKYGSKSVSVKTTSYALTIPITITRKFTITPTSTITPPPQTTISTTTSTTTSTVVTTPTDTFTETDSVTSTSTTTQVVTTDTTTTTSTTSSVATYTVPTPAGFTPLASEPGYVPKKRSVEVPAIRGRTVEERAAVQKPVCPQVGKPGSFSQYPQIVTCGALVVAKTTSTRTYTATSTITTTLPVSTSTTTSTATTTEITTSAAAPASTTITETQSFSTTEIATSTTTNTATQTITIVEASSTVYAACSANNVINHANSNQGIYQVYYAGSGAAPTTNEVGISDPVACCEQCQKTPGCTGYAKYPGAARCFVFTQGQCDGSQNLGQFFKTSADFSPNDGYTIGNGQCGQITNGGSG